MGMIGLGQVEVVTAKRTISGNAQYMPDSSTVLSKSGGAASDAWGTTMLAQLNGTSDGYCISPNQDFTVQFIGNTGNGDIEVWDPVTSTWINWISITDAKAHDVKAPIGSFRIGCAVQAGTTAVIMRASRQSGTP